MHFYSSLTLYLKQFGVRPNYLNVFVVRPKRHLSIYHTAVSRLHMHVDTEGIQDVYTDSVVRLAFPPVSIV